MEVPQYVQAFQDTMAWKAAKPVALAGMTDPSYARDQVGGRRLPRPIHRTELPIGAGPPCVCAPSSAIHARIARSTCA